MLHYYRYHSYCWTNWKTGKVSEKLLQEVLAVGGKTQHSNSGKNTVIMPHFGDVQTGSGMKRQVNVQCLQRKLENSLKKICTLIG